MHTPSLRSAALAVALLAFGATLSAQGRGQSPMGEGHGFRGLNLSEAQKTQMKAIHDKHQDALKAKGDIARAAHQALREGMANAATDTTTLRALHDKASAAQFDLRLEHRALHQEILPLLTEAQKIQFEKRGPGMGHPGVRGRGRGRSAGHGLKPGMGPGMNPGGPVVQPS